MSGAHIHLILNHVPIVGITLAAFILAYGLFGREQSVISLALRLVVFLSLATLPVYLSGEPAEEVIKNLAGVSEELIEAHEEFAEVALILVLASGVLALFSLIWRSKPVFVKLTLLSLFLSVAALIWTGKLGGEIRHPEVRRANSTNQ